MGRTIAHELGFRYADEEIIARAAEKAGVSPETIAEIEHTPGLITRILEAMSRAPADPADPQTWVVLATSPPRRSSEYEGLIERVVKETANEGNVVIVAHGTSIPLAGTEGVLRVLVTASPEVRAERLASLANVDERAARKAIDDSDHQRREYMRRFYDVRQELPTHYDLVVNTDVLTVQQAAQVVASAARGL